MSEVSTDFLASPPFSMKEFDENNPGSCPREEIAAYVDGELAPFEELELEGHLGACPVCRSELGSQKALLMQLENALEGGPEGITLPTDFARVVAANAESNVEGIRSRRERSFALFVCGALALIITLSAGTEAASLVSAFERFADQFGAVAGFMLHIGYEFGVGVGIVLGSLGQRFIYNSAITAALTLLVFILSAFALSRLVFAFKRTQ